MMCELEFWEGYIVINVKEFVKGGGWIMFVD